MLTFDIGCSGMETMAFVIKAVMMKHEDILNIEILDIPTYEETKLSYVEDFAS